MAKARRTPRVTVECGFCKKSFELSKYEFSRKRVASKSGLMFCSKPCHTNSRFPLDTYVECECRWCKKKFKKMRNEAKVALERRGKIFCSRECSDSLKRVDFKKIFKTRKTCSLCKETKEISRFGALRKSLDGKASACRECYNAERAAWGKDRKARHALFTRISCYGLTFSQFEEMLIESNDLCKICTRHTKKLVIDHCHETGRVRGLICTACNNGLGMFKDNKKFLENAITYLRSDKDERLRGL